MRQHDTQSHHTKSRTVRANGRPHNAELVGDLLSLRRQLAVVAASPAVVAAHQLTAEVSLVLEPVWNVLATSDESTGVGFLRRLGNTTAGVEALNTAVVRQAVQTYQALNLVAPTMRDV